MQKRLVPLAAMALLAAAGCGGTPETKRGLQADLARRPATARTRQEFAPPKPAAARAAPYAVRSFTAAGSGTLTLDGSRHSFQVADCRLVEEKLPSGFVRDVWVSGSGTMKGRPFFFTLSRARKGRKSNVSMIVHLAPMPAALQVGGYDLGTREGLEVMEALSSADSLRSMGLAGLQQDQIRVESGRVTTTGTFRLQRFDQGSLSNAPAVAATLELSCGS